MIENDDVETSRKCTHASESNEENHEEPARRAGAST